MKKSILSLMVLALTGSIMAPAFAVQDNVESTTITKLSDVKTVETKNMTVSLPVVEAATLATKKHDTLFNGHSLKLYHVSVVRHEVKKMTDIQPLLASGKLYVSVSKHETPSSDPVLYSASSAQSEPFLYIITKEHAYIQSVSVESKEDKEVTSVTPGIAKEGFYLLIDSERTKENNLLSKITLTEKRITNMKNLGNAVSGPDSKEFSVSNRVFSKPGDTLIIHSVPYKEGDKNYQNVYSITIR